MRTLRDVEAYLGRLNRRFSGVDGQEGDLSRPFVRTGCPPIAVLVDPPLVVLRVHIGDAPKPGSTSLSTGSSSS